jgi:hypothetical protein
VGETGDKRSSSVAYDEIEKQTGLLAKTQGLCRSRGRRKERLNLLEPRWSCQAFER